jgi:hypothetical protein
MHIQTDARHSDGLQVQAQEGDGTDLARGPQQVECPHNISGAPFERIRQPFLCRDDTTQPSSGAVSRRPLRNSAARRNAFTPVRTDPPTFTTTIFGSRQPGSLTLPLFETTSISETHSATESAAADVITLGNEILSSDRVPVSRGPYLSRAGQEEAPGHCCLVAVASSGLSPQPLWISAAGQRRRRTNRRASSGELLFPLASVFMNKLLPESGQLNCAYPWFCENEGSCAPFSKKSQKHIATRLGRQVRQKLPVCANQNAVAFAMNEHPEPLEAPKVHHRSEMLWNVSQFPRRDLANRLSQQLRCLVADQSAKFRRDSLEFSFDGQCDVVVRS